MKKGKMKKIVIIIIVILVVLSVVGKFLGKKNSNKKTVKVTVEKVKLDKIESKVLAKGVVAVKNKETIYLSTPLKIKKVNFKAGDNVKKGNIIIIYDTEKRKELEYSIKKMGINIENEKLALKELMKPLDEISLINKKHDIEQLKNDMKKSELSLEKLNLEAKTINKNIKKTEDEVEKKEELYKNGMIAKEELEKTKDNLDNYKSSLASNNIEQKQFDINLKDTQSRIEFLKTIYEDAKNKFEMETKTREDQIKIKENSIDISLLELKQEKEKLQKMVRKTVSPVTGTILKLNAEKNYIVNIEKPVVEIADISKLIIKSEVSEYDAPKLKLGEKVVIKSDALNDKKYYGKVYKISELAHESKNRDYKENIVNIEILFDNSKKILKPGYSVNLEIITAKKESAKLISILSIMEKDKQKYVYVVDKENKLEKRDIKIGVESDFYVEVVKGLNEGDKVVVNPEEKIAEGMKVEVLDKELGSVKNDN
ncbi:efflux RND transporter periplasmic adaptor subunit [Haliovirga abyssi]|uniref:Efflux RND transporter periplasmic adaptor subunit n=1 Tax=Haliovirga abyssi TaxID=2996794 RepID=A0AAU9DBJ1_9FUSO|nr:efflux RND transporter periplasmic adaptor subunit [Haliovirga abyssi]BDU50826.1 hypothetical protein HLVA_13950 [Haliovirga abyssi]